MRTRRTLTVPIVLTIVMMGLNISLMIWWIINTASSGSVTGLTLGTIAFSLVLIGLSFYLLLTIKERQLYQRQVNFVDSVTHELKSPIASLRLYLETLKLRQLEESKRAEFYETMDGELERLDDMINQLLQVARLDAIGDDSPVNHVDLAEYLESCAIKACQRRRIEFKDTFELNLHSTTVCAPKIMLDMIFGNLMDNAIKYGGEDPKVGIKTRTTKNRKIEIEIVDNGEGIPHDIRNKIFRLFFRGGDELQRRQKGTGIGLYIASTLVRKLKGKISVHHRADGSGSSFKVELPRAQHK